jgi:hypothetical protein
VLLRELPQRTRLAGTALVGGGVVFQAVWLGLPATALGVALVVALTLWLCTDWRLRPGFALAYGVGIAVFGLHVAEEYSTQFQDALPALFGRTGWSDARYLAFNGVWAVVFLGSWWAVGRGQALGVLVATFFAVGGGVGNGAAHLVLAVARGGYFPGAWTAPACLGVGVWMLLVLYRSEPSPPPPNERIQPSAHNEIVRLSSVDRAPTDAERSAPPSQLILNSLT